MPLPHFLLLLMAVILAAALTLWLSFAIGMPEIMLALLALAGAALVHMSVRNHHDSES
ncbi:hypothetical protein SAMN04489859_101282 [Paracoccus alcaliphilus]|mgnify:CR=1 FL=1|uniref:Uncharacterized protein n=1 Tax=Paracoccus alcaliphilus TaxID=34002 RepID=A0A1H8IF02_9RHOB|nr:hypothetical protein [Paracoccus alcaliphilus]WCR19142.1 hypothetical protein JHW40_05515 [Paracoccus alcaliphilus]SEN66849.1 hypothetical protein SAMN04489859_101282 [Paracoccus alcaliphilus]